MGQVPEAGALSGERGTGNGQRRSGYALFGALSVVALIGWQTPSVSPITNPPTRVAGLSAHDDSAAGSLFGQFRTNLTAWLWLHADLYLHNGVGMRPLTDGEIKAGVVQQKAANDGNENLDSEAIVTSVPSKERDFRGVFGDVEREIAAFKNMHDHAHNDPEQCLPLYRLMTWLDPQFIEGWTTGAMVFARDRSPGGTKRALAFLTEGLGPNPDSIDLMSEMAYMYITRIKDNRQAIPWLEKARGNGYAHRLTLTEAERDALDNAYRWLCLCYRDIGDKAAVERVAAEGMTLFNDDKVLDRLMRHAEGATTSGADEVEGLRRAGE